jgi:hypothetical protein
MPRDIAVVSDTTPAGSMTASGKLTMLFNDGHGAFIVGTIQALGLAPGSLANRLRAGGKTDLLIRDANANRFLFLVNIEPDPNAFRPAIGRTRASSTAPAMSMRC